EKFLEALIENAPAHCHIVLSGRGLPRLPWMALIARRKAIMLRDAEIIRRNFYDNQSLDNPRLRLTGFGQGEVNLDGRVVTGWEGHLPRLLLFFALERPYTTRSEMCVEFWPELQVDQAVNVFHVTKRRLHKALDGIGNDILIHVGSYYRIIADLTLHYDVDDFVGAILAGRLAEDPAERLAAWNRVIELHAHPFLQGHPEKWIVRRRHDYLTGWIEAMTGIAAQRHAEGRTENALLLYQKAVGEDVRRQDIHRQIMALYSELGRRSEIQTYYGRMRDDLKAAGTAIEGETKSLYETLMAAD
ncbi:MAG TPA: BTAD domain-containing putative transcriptional regulator, partial [Aggregatilineales bacterium]|nr:BTAD domain-containing putative transcriptional regulator [Aggregatilineales bacterium]